MDFVKALAVVLKTNIEKICLIFYIWFVLSIVCSSFMAITGVCDKKYPIGYVFYSRLFCEIK